MTFIAAAFACSEYVNWDVKQILGCSTGGLTRFVNGFVAPVRRPMMTHSCQRIGMVCIVTGNGTVAGEGESTRITTRNTALQTRTGRDQAVSNWRRGVDRNQSSVRSSGLVYRWYCRQVDDTAPKNSDRGRLRTSERATLVSHTGRAFYMFHDIIVRRRTVFENRSSSHSSNVTWKARLVHWTDQEQGDHCQGNTCMRKLNATARVKRKVKATQSLSTS